ncbi:TetR/AcrR family transcriptional regulator C-terminal domain-containing protein [Actinomadura rayongensis]
MNTDERRASIWERMEQPAPEPRVVLTHASIAAAAIEIADTEGLESMSIRRLARRMNLAPMGLYRYVASKEEILELMFNAALEGGPATPDADADWRDVLRATAYHTREVMLAHPWLGKVVTMILTGLAPNRLACFEQALTALDGLGLDADTSMAVVDSVMDYTMGATSRDLTVLDMMRREGWESMDEMRDAYADEMSWHMSTGRYPAFERWVREGRRKDDMAWRFDYGLDCILDGIETRLGPHARRCR